MKNLKKILAIILSIAMVMCSTLPSVASEIEVIDETTSVGANACGARPEEEENQIEEQADEEVEEPTATPSELSEIDEEETGTEETTMAEPVELEISIESKSTTDKTLYGVDEPWMYWWLTDEDGDSTLETIHFSSTDPGGVNAIGINSKPDERIDYGWGDYEEWMQMRLQFTKAVFEDKIDAVTCNFLFAFFNNLKVIDNIDNLKTDNVKSMGSMFQGCQSLTELDLSNFNTKNVTTLECFLTGCDNLDKIDLSKFDTSNVLNMRFAFGECKKFTVLDLSSFDTENVGNMENMFLNCLSLEKIIVSEKFVTSNVSSSDNMFSGSTNLVGGAGTTYDGGHINKEYARIDEGDSNPGYFTRAPWMYCWLTYEDKTIHYQSYDPGGVGAKPITGTGAISYDGLNLRERINIRKAVFEDEIEAETCQNLFYGFERLETIEKIENLKTSKVTNMDSMFYACYQLTALDVTNFDTSSVTNMAAMFRGCLSLKKIIVSEKFVTSNVISSNYMFGDCTNLVGGAGTTYDSENTDYEYARIDGGPTSATPGYFTLYVPPTPPAPTPTYPQNYSSDRDGGGGGGGSIAGPLVDVIIPAVTYLPIVKNILATLNNTTSKWTKDAVTNKHKLNIINQNGTETPATLGFYNYTNVATHIVNNVPVQTHTNDTYVFDDKGNMITGWVRTADGKWYLFEYEKTTNEGKMVIGWKKVQGAWYYFGTDGAMLTNAYTPDGHYVGPDGKWVENWGINKGK